jgi:hypothetical protein
LPDGIEVNIETNVSGDGKSSNGDGTGADADEVVDSDGDGDEDGTSDDINMEKDEGNLDEAHMSEDDEDGGGLTTLTTGRQTGIQERCRQEISASDLDTV